MSSVVTFNAQQYNVPAYNDTGYAQGNGNLSQYLVAIASGTLQQSGGLFQLTADADLGPNFGLKALYLKSETTNIGATGVVRLARADSIVWRNQANNADLTLGINSSNDLTFNGVAIAGAASYTANRAIVSDGTGAISVATTTSTEIGYLSGVTSAIQTQINSKAPTASPTFTGVILAPNNAASSPSYSFTNSTNSGLYLQATGHPSIAAAGSEICRFTSTEILPFVPIGSANNGTAGAPQYSFDAQTTTGIYLAAVGTLAASVAGSAITAWNASAFFPGNSGLNLGQSTDPWAKMYVNNTGIMVGGNQVFPIVQIVTATSTSSKSSTSSTYADTNLTASITPKFNTSKIYILASGSLQTGAAATSLVTLARGGSNLLATQGGQQSSATGTVPCFLQFYDSPATTSSITYSVQLKNSDNVTTVQFGLNSTQFMMLVEIAQ